MRVEEFEDEVMAFMTANEPREPLTGWYYTDDMRRTITPPVASPDPTTAWAKSLTEFANPRVEVKGNKIRWQREKPWPIEIGTENNIRYLVAMYEYRVAGVTPVTMEQLRSKLDLSADTIRTAMRTLRQGGAVEENPTGVYRLLIDLEHELWIDIARGGKYPGHITTLARALVPEDQHDYAYLVSLPTASQRHFIDGLIAYHQREWAHHQEELDRHQAQIEALEAVRASLQSS